MWSGTMEVLLLKITTGCHVAAVKIIGHRHKQYHQNYYIYRMRMNRLMEGKFIVNGKCVNKEIIILSWFTHKSAPQTLEVLVWLKRCIKLKMAEHNGIISTEEEYGDEMYQEPFPSEAFSPPDPASMNGDVEDGPDVVEVPQDSPRVDAFPQEEGEIPAEPLAAEVPETMEDPENNEQKGELEKEKVNKPKAVPDKNYRAGPQAEGQRKGYRLFQKPDVMAVNGGVRKLIELKGNIKLKPRIRDPIKRVFEDKSACCFAPSKRGFYLHFRTCVVSKESIWAGNAGQRVKTPYLTMLKEDPEVVLRPTMSDDTIWLAKEIINVTHQCEAELDILWASFGTTRCHQSCLKEEVLRMAACLSVLMRSGVSISHYQDLATLDEVWDRMPSVGKKLLQRMEEAAQRDIVFQISCNDPSLASTMCHAATLRKQSSKLLKRYRDQETELREKIEKMNNRGLEYLRLSVFDALMYGLNRNVQRCEQLFWSSTMRRYALKVQNRRYLYINGLTRDEAAVPTLDEGHSSALNLEAPAVRHGGDRGRSSGEVNPVLEEGARVDDGVDQPALAIPWHVEHGHRGDQGRPRSPRGERGVNPRSERRTVDLRDHIKQKERRQ